MTTDVPTLQEEERYRAVLGLDPAGAGTLESLISALHDESWRVRRAAAEAARRLPAPGEVALRLVSVLGERGETGARNAAAEALVGLGDVALGPLIRLLGHSDPDQRKFAADILGQLGRRGAENALIQALADPDLNVRVSAVEAVGRVGSEVGARALERLLKEEEPLLRLAVLEALTQLQWPPPLPVVVPLLAEGRLRRSAYRVLGLIPQVAATELISRGLGSELRSVREAALGALGTQASVADTPLRAEIDAQARTSLKRLPNAMEFVSQAFEAEDYYVRAGALVAAGALREPTLAVLVAEAAREDRLLREVIRTLSRLGAEAGRELLGRMAELSLPARAAAAQALLEMVDPSYVPALSALLEWAEDDLRAVAVKALGRTQSPDAVAPLVALLDEPALAGAAVRALGVLSGGCREAVIKALEAVMEQRPVPAAVAAYAHAGGTAALPTLRRLARDADPLLRAAALDAAVDVDPAVGLELARGALVDEAAPVRASGARVVGRVGDASAGSLLRRALQDEDIAVRLAAVEALGEIGAAERATDLEAMVRHPDGALAGRAVRALARMGTIRPEVLRQAARHSDAEVVKAALQAGAVSAEGVALAVEMLGHPGWDVRATAARVLGDAGGRESLEAVQAALASEQDALARRALSDAVERLSRR
ncbi:HEAT repeat domain-containing protein [Hyalangium rubrum]|uniref:HEAT repeat domain-containing protein n=1 Tax=Hyalangium rubrum TaxID=3103134 RepID=A0ABU5H8Y4_9BACT|nr:HEAT repeat domain-containing protein [Hyalangium sp. s54d21]MDY7229943.1 HEAT repeat domain-containing protein [Hyalangium sp. s54d21]